MFRAAARSIVFPLVLAAISLSQPLPVSTPEKEGFSKERLARLHSAFEGMTKEGKKAGAITMILRNGKIVDWRAYGHRDLAAGLPMEKDTICKIWSMTKVVTSVAVMMLVEEGKLSINDRVDTYIPEFKDRKVFKGGTADNPQLAPATRPMTVKHLLTHTSGLPYPSKTTPGHELYDRAKVFDVDSLKEFAGKLQQLPLINNPGDKYEYSIGIDVLGYLVEVVSGMPFDQFVQKRILDPLKMEDTHFQVPAEKQKRMSKTYRITDGKLVEASLTELQDRGVPFGGMSLYSTIGDYARFGQMLLNGGQFNGVRLLGRKTVELMTVNHLNHMTPPTISGNDGYGFGLGGSVRIDIAKSGTLGSLGVFGWDGAATTHFRMDPKEKTVVLMFLQYLPFDTPTIEKFDTLFYQALVD